MPIPKKINILVTGGTGFLGEEFIIAKKNKYNIYATYRTKHPKISEIKWLKLDLIKKKNFEEIYRKLKNIHISAIIHIGGSSPNRAYAEGNFDATILGTKYLLNFGEKLKTSKFIFISSIVVTLPYKGPYADSKRLAEQKIKKSKLIYTIFRPETIVGRYAKDLSRAVKVLQTKKFFPIFGSGENLTQPIASEDLIAMIDYSVANPITDNKIYPAVGAEIVSLKAFLSYIASKKNNKIRFIKIPMWLSRIIVKIAGKINPRWGLNDERLNFTTCSRKFPLDFMLDFPSIKLKSLKGMSFPEGKT